MADKAAGAISVKTAGEDHVGIVGAPIETKFLAIA